MEQHYCEFRARQDAISRDYYQQFSGGKTLVYFKHMSAYKQFIHKVKTPFNPYTPRAERTYAYIIKGLHIEVTVNDIKAELTELGVNVRTSIKKL